MVVIQTDRTTPSGKLRIITFEKFVKKDLVMRISPPEEIRANIHALALELFKSRVKVMPPYTYNVVMPYLGTVKDGKSLDTIKQVAAEVNAPPFEMEISGLSQFQSHNQGAIFVGVGEGADRMTVIFSKMMTELSNRNLIEGLKQRPLYIFHITAGYIDRKGDDGTVLAAIKAHSEHKFGSFVVDRIPFLLRMRNPQGHLKGQSDSLYTLLSEIRLQG